MILTPDQVVYWSFGSIRVNATIAFTWLVMAILMIGSWAVTRRLSTGVELSRGQNALEVVVSAMQEQIRDVTRDDPGRYLPFIGTLFLFIATSNLLAIIPGFLPPTGSLSTAAALAACVFVSVPYFGIRERGLREYLRCYAQPSVLMLPFNVIGELSRTLALAIRLFGNVMSGTLIGGMLLAIAPLFFPVLIQILGLLTGIIQAYIFAILALVYTASVARSREGRGKGESGHG